LVVAVVAVAALVMTGRRNGQLEERLKNSDARNQVKERMRDAVANTRTDRAGVADRMRDGSF
jgi:hypothetical protein